MTIQKQHHNDDDVHDASCSATSSSLVSIDIDNTSSPVNRVNNNNNTVQRTLFPGRQFFTKERQSPPSGEDSQINNNDNDDDDSDSSSVTQPGAIHMVGRRVVGRPSIGNLTPQTILIPPEAMHDEEQNTIITQSETKNKRPIKCIISAIIATIGFIILIVVILKLTYRTKQQELQQQNGHHSGLFTWNDLQHKCKQQQGQLLLHHDENTVPMFPEYITTNYIKLQAQLFNITNDNQSKQNGTDTIIQPCNPQQLAILSMSLVNQSMTTNHLLTEWYSLAVLFFSTNGDQWRKQENWLSTPNVCEWEGVDCQIRAYDKEEEEEKVEGLLLNANGLLGNLPEDLFLLTNLRVLDFEDNDIEGTISTNFGRLTNLTYLNLSRNGFTGVLPEEMFTLLSNMEYLDLHLSPLSGTLPSVMFNESKKWRHIDLSDQFFRGTIPTSIGNLQQLTYLRLFLNRLSGEIPFEIGNCSSLEYLNFDGNKLNGTIPKSIAALRHLRALHLGENQLSGTIPSDIGNCSNLEILRLRRNFNMNGTIPPTIGNLENLQKLELGDNQFTGEIPIEISQCTNLVALNVRNNHLTGTIPTELGRLKSLQNVILCQNNFRGTVPKEFFYLRNLMSLEISTTRGGSVIPFFEKDVCRMGNRELSIAIDRDRRRVDDYDPCRGLSCCLLHEDASDCGSMELF